MILKNYSLAQKLLLIFLGLCFLVGCESQSEIKRSEDLDNPKSVLLDALVQTSDFSLNWEWLFETITQKEVSPNVENNSQIEFARKGLESRRINGKENFVEVWHTLSCYENDVSIVVSDLGTADDKDLVEFSPPQVGNMIYTMCKTVETSNQITCKILIDYGHILSELIVDIPDNLTDQVNDIVNNIILKTDKRIKNIKNCSS